METPLYEFSLPCNIFGMGYIFFFSFFLTHLVGVWHTFFGYASFLSFFFFDMPCVAHLLWLSQIMMITLERYKDGTTWSFICG